MDGMILVAFFFPAVVVLNFFLLIFSFFLTLFIYFYHLINPFSYLHSLFLSFTISHPLFLPLFLNLITSFSVVSTYALGHFLHAPQGWTFFQPWKGGFAFILVQIGTWSCLAVSLSFPWLSLDNIGLLHFYLNNQQELERESHGILSVIASLFGLVSQTFAFMSLIAFDKRAERKQQISRFLNQMFKRKKNIDALFQHKLKLFQELANSEAAAAATNEGQSDNKHLYNKSLRNLYALKKLSKITVEAIDTQELNLEKLFNSDPTGSYLYLFLTTQLLTVIYSTVLTILIDSFSKNINSFVKNILLVTFLVIVTLTLAITNAVGGKWRHGTLYKVIMIGKGGPKFIFAQAIAWSCYGGCVLVTGQKMLSINFGMMEAYKGNYMKYAGLLGILSEVCLVYSLSLFKESKKTAQPVKPDSTSLREPTKVPNQEISTPEIIDDKEERSRAKVRRSARTRSKTKSPGKAKAQKSKRKNARETKNKPETREVWEEFEDENGNVFYVNITTGESVQELPQGSVEVSED